MAKIKFHQFQRSVGRELLQGHLKIFEKAARGRSVSVCRHPNVPLCVAPLTKPYMPTKIPSINVITVCEPSMLQKLGTAWSVRQTGWPLCLVGEHDFYETSVLISDRTLRPCSACQSAYADCML